MNKIRKSVPASRQRSRYAMSYGIFHERSQDQLWRSAFTSGTTNIVLDDFISWHMES